MPSATVIGLHSGHVLPYLVVVKHKGRIIRLEMKTGRCSIWTDNSSDFIRLNLKMERIYFGRTIRLSLSICLPLNFDRF